MSNPSPTHYLAIHPISPEEINTLEKLAENSVGADVACVLVPSGQLVQLIAEVRRQRQLALTRRDAAAALWACQYARKELDEAVHVGTLDAAISKLARVQIAGPV